MTKKIILLIFPLLAFFSGKSQILISLVFGDKLNSEKLEFGLDGGLSMTTIQGIDNAKYSRAFNLGFYFDIKLKDTTNWTINTGVVVKSPMGAQDLSVYSLNNIYLDTIFGGGSVRTKLRYFSVPILVKYKFKNNIFIKGGIQAALINHGEDLFTNKVVEDDDLTYTEQVKSNYNPIDFGFIAGLDTDLWVEME